MKTLNQDLLNELLRYDKFTGELVWKYRSKNHFKNNSIPHKNMWNTKYADKEAFTSINKLGYKEGSLLNRHLLAHRVIWCIVYGDWPENIDHIDGNPSNNRINNLRSVPKKINSRNQKLRVNNVSGVNGVSWSKTNKKWMVQISTDLGRKTLGFFDCLKEAALCREHYNANNGYHYNHGKVKGIA